MMSAHAQLLALTSSSPAAFHYSHHHHPKNSSSSSIPSRRCCTNIPPTPPHRRPLLPALKVTTTATTTYPTPVIAAIADHDQQSQFQSPPSTDHLDVLDLHHVEFWCADAASAAGRFSFGLGIPFAATSGIITGNATHASYALRSRTGSLAFLFSAPYAPRDSTGTGTGTGATVPSFCADSARLFTANYGLAVRALAVRVADAAAAFSASVDAGARPALAPAELGHGFVMAEVELFGDVVLRFVSYPDDSASADVTFLPGFESVANPDPAGSPDFGLTHFDHIAAGVPDLASVASYVARFTGFRQVSDFGGDKVGTTESSLKGLVLGDTTDTLLLTLLEPVHGTKRRSQVQTFLDYHGGPGVQHLAMATDDLLGTLRKIQARSSVGGFELLPPPSPSYYDDVRLLAGDVLSQEQIDECQRLGVLVDRDDNGGVVLQIFTKAAVDRPTLLLEFVQRIRREEGNHKEYPSSSGYGGFAKGNVYHIFKSIEDYEKSLLDTPAPPAAS